MDALDLAGYVVKYGVDHYTPVSNLQLQKILYFLQIRSIQINGAEFPIMETPHFEAWPFGPVIRKVYEAFHLSGGMPIIIFPKKIRTDAIVENYVDECLSTLCAKKSWNLVDFAHRKDGAWAKNYIEGLKTPIKDEDICIEANSLPNNFIQSI